MFLFQTKGDISAKRNYAAIQPASYSEIPEHTMTLGFSRSDCLTG